MNNKPPIVGDFRSTTSNAPRTAPVTVNTVEGDAPVMSSTALSNVQPGTISDPVQYEAAKARGSISETPSVGKELTPAELYQNRLKDAGIDLLQARSILDAVISGGYYEESFTLAGRKGTFRTRSYANQRRIAKALEVENPATGYAQNELIVRYNLAASLVEWAGNRYYTGNDEKQFQDKLVGLDDFPGPVITLLSNELAKFDAKMMIVFSDGAIDSF
jgi:hypothetical protein